jgi:hypothetical protein
MNWNDAIKIDLESGGCSYEDGDKISGSIKGGEFRNYLSDYQFLKYVSEPWSKQLDDWFTLPISSRKTIT